jgi:hypothetical protein
MKKLFAIALLSFAGVALALLHHSQQARSDHQRSIWNEALMSVALFCSSTPKHEASFDETHPFPLFVTTGATITEAERLQTKRECHALERKGLPQIRNEFESQFDYAVFYSSKTNSCLVARFTRWKNGGEYAEIKTIPGDGAGVWYEYYSTQKSTPEIEKILSEQVDTLK